MSRPVLLVCVDLSDASAPVLAAVPKLTGAAEARAFLLHVAAPEPDFVGYDPPGGPFDAATRSAELTDEQAQLQTMADDLRARDIEVEVLLRQGPTVETILGTADEVGADLVVVGSHGHGAVHHLLVGSTTEALIKQAAIPVVVVPARG